MDHRQKAYKDGEGSRAIQVDEVTWSVQPGQEETEGRPHCSYNFLTRGRGRASTDLSSVVTVTGHKGMA